MTLWAVFWFRKDLGWTFHSVHKTEEAAKYDAEGLEYIRKCNGQRSVEIAVFRCAKK